MLFRYIESLEIELWRADFAVLLLTPDDKVISRSRRRGAPRDNLIFELGLFVGAITRMRTLMAIPSGVDLKIPTDMLGVEPIRYSGNNLRKIVTVVSSRINDLGPS